jgi:hypothetical protein
VIASIWPPWEYTDVDWSGLQTAVLMVQTLILVAAGRIAWVQASEARNLRIERSRPFVIVDLAIYQTIAEFKITNIGATPTSTSGSRRCATR